MKYSEMTDMTVEQLVAKEQELREELFKYRFRHSKNDLENTNLIRNTRKDIARIKTLLTSKQKGTGVR